MFKLLVNVDRKLASVNELLRQGTYNEDSLEHERLIELGCDLERIKEYIGNNAPLDRVMLRSLEVTLLSLSA